MVDVSIAPTQRQFSEYRLDAPRRRLLALFYHRFLFLMTEELVKASYHGFIVNGFILVPLVGMYIAE